MVCFLVLGFDQLLDISDVLFPCQSVCQGAVMISLTGAKFGFLFVISFAWPDFMRFL